MPEEAKIKIAILEEQIKGLREQHKAHAVETKKSIDEISGMMNELVALINKGKGAYWITLVFGGSLMAGISWAISQLLMLKGH